MLSWWKICLQFRRPEFDFWVRKIPWRRDWLPPPVFLPRGFHRQRSLVGYIVHGVAKSQTWLSTHTQWLYIYVYILFIMGVSVYWYSMFSSSYVMLQEFSHVVKCSLKVLCSINSMKHNKQQNKTVQCVSILSKSVYYLY